MSESYKRLELHFRKQLSGDFLGSFLSAFKGQGIEFESLRGYIPGDSIKAIDWKATAKMGDVFVRSYQEEKDLQVLFILEDTGSLSFGSEQKTKRELMREVFFTLAYSSVLSSHSVGVIIGQKFLDFKRSKENIVRTIDMLESGEQLDKKSKNITKLPLKNTLIFILGDSLNPDINTLKFLQVRNEIITISLSDYFEYNLTQENISFSGYNFGNFLGIFGLGKNKVSEYKKKRGKTYEELQKKLGKRNITTLALDTRSNIFLALYTFFQKYKK